MGSNNQTAPAVDMCATFYRCHFETYGRQPLIARIGATTHLVNCVAWWHDKYNRAVDTANAGREIVEGEVVGTSS